MPEKILITGGAGFIGSHLADELLAHDYEVRVLDTMIDQVHEGAARPEYLAADVELVHGDPFTALERTTEQLARGVWDPADTAGRPLQPVPTPETKTPALASVYALTKYDQERLCLIFGEAYGMPAVALRFFNTYGTRQALSNPYTGVLAIFASRLLNGRPPRVFEDGLQRRDFVSVSDVVRACLLALERDGADGNAVNVGTGRAVTVLEVAEKLGRVLRVGVEPEVTGKYRAGDIRHCFADITRARELLGYEPQIELEDGMADLAEWLADQVAVDRADDAAAELAARGLTR